MQLKNIRCHTCSYRLVWTQDIKSYWKLKERNPAHTTMCILCVHASVSFFFRLIKDLSYSWQNNERMHYFWIVVDSGFCSTYLFVARLIFRQSYYKHTWCLSQHPLIVKHFPFSNLFYDVFDPQRMRQEVNNMLNIIIVIIKCPRHLSTWINLIDSLHPASTNIQPSFFTRLLLHSTFLLSRPSTQPSNKKKTVWMSGTLLWCTPVRMVGSVTFSDLSVRP